MKFWKFRDKVMDDNILVAEEEECIRIFIKEGLKVESYYSYWSEIDYGKKINRYEFIEEFRTLNVIPSSELFQ